MPAEDANISPQKELEPDSNFPHSVFINEQGDDNSGEIVEQWIQDTLYDLEAPASKLVDYYLLNSRILCIFEDRTVKYIGFSSKDIEKSFKLDEVEDFELGDSNQVKAFTLEKDVQLMGVAFEDCVHVFEFDEEAGEEETGLSYVTKLEMPNVTKMIFVEYHLVLMQEDGVNVTLGCADLDSASVENTETIVKPSEDAKIILRSGVDATDTASIYYATGS